MQFINPADWDAPKGYNNGALVEGGKTLYIAGQVAWDAQQQMVSDDFAEQFGQAMANVVAVVNAAGGGPENIATLTIFCADQEEYNRRLKDVGAKYREVMGKHFPAMTMVQVADFVEEGAQIEIQGIAHLS